MTTTELINFKKRVANYTSDNLAYIEEYVAEPTAQDVIEHWDTNGPEGIGEPLTDEQREVFLQVAEAVIREGHTYVI